MGIQAITKNYFSGRSREDHVHMSIWTYAFQRMSFGLCHALATFQHCMMAIFADLVENLIEVFMDDFRYLRAHLIIVSTT